MNEEKLISGRYQVNVKTARKIKLYAMIKNVSVGAIVRIILERDINEYLPDDVFKEIDIGDV